MCAAAGKALTTNSRPLRSLAISRRAIARRRRFTRFRTTAVPTELDTMKPKRASPADHSRRHWTITALPAVRRPRRATNRKSACAVIRFARASTFLLGGELGAALATPRGKNRPTRASAHAKTESVYLRAAAVVRLEGSLAHSDISKAQLWGRKEVGSRSAEVNCLKIRPKSSRVKLCTVRRGYSQFTNWGWCGHPVEN